MPTDHPVPQPAGEAPVEPAREQRPLLPAAERALAEAAARRAARTRAHTTPTPEVGGRGGLDPTRYGDWEINGLAADF